MTNFGNVNVKMILHIKFPITMLVFLIFLKITSSHFIYLIIKQELNHRTQFYKCVRYMKFMENYMKSDDSHNNAKIGMIAVNFVNVISNI